MKYCQSLFFDRYSSKLSLSIWQQYPIKDGLLREKCKIIVRRDSNITRQTRQYFKKDQGLFDLESG